ALTRWRTRCPPAGPSPWGSAGQCSRAGASAWRTTCSTPWCRESGTSSPAWACPSSPCCSWRSEEHTSELQSRSDLVCRLLLEKKKKIRDLELLGRQKKKAIQ